jgi:hypothetical protein
MEAHNISIQSPHHSARRLTFLSHPMHLCRSTFGVGCSPSSSILFGHPGHTLPDTFSEFLDLHPEVEETRVVPLEMSLQLCRPMTDSFHCELEYITAKN